MAFDSKCFDLAEYFLPSDVPETRELAQVIQDAIEDFLQSREHPRADCEGCNQPDCPCHLTFCCGKIPAQCSCLSEQEQEQA